MTSYDKERLKAMRVLLQRMLEKQFGPLSDRTVARLAALSEDRLFQVGEALLTATSLKELGLEK
jgi:hypothetical protein